MLINLTRKPFNRMWFSQGLTLKDMFLKFRDNLPFNSGKYTLKVCQAAFML